MGAPRQRDFRFFLKSQGLDLARDADVQKMVELCFSKKNRPGLETAFWRFEGVPVADNPDLKKEILRRTRSSDRSLGAVAKIIIEEMVRLSGKSRAAAVFPVDIQYTPELIAWFPDCRILHITRDPRAIAMSKSSDPTGTAIRVSKHPRFAWAIRKVTTLYVIHEYRKFARFHRQFEGLENYRLFRYEDLLVEPEKVLREACDFVGCEFTPDMLEPEKGAHEHQASSLTGKKHKAFDLKAAVRWQEVISSLDRWMITQFTGSSMKVLDYNPAIHPVFRKGAAI